MKAIGHLWREHRLALLIFLGGAAIALFFTVRLVLFTVYWADPAHRDQTPDGWMTPGYIARSWHVPREDLARHLGLVPGTDPHLTLEQIAEDRGIPLAKLIADLSDYLAAGAAK